MTALLGEGMDQRVSWTTCGWMKVRKIKRYRAGDKKEMAQSVGPALHVVRRSVLEMFKTPNT
jgi:hypothetical protein